MARGSGQWAKKIRGKLFCFGIWDDPRAAESKWDRDKEALLEGRNPEESRHGDSIGWLCNLSMDEKHAEHKRGPLKTDTLHDYHRVCKHVAAYFGNGTRLDTLS